MQFVHSQYANVRLDLEQNARATCGPSPKKKAGLENDCGKRAFKKTKAVRETSRKRFAKLKSMPLRHPPIDHQVVSNLPRDSQCPRRHAPTTHGEFEVWVSTPEGLSPKESLDLLSAPIWMRCLLEVSRAFQVKHACRYFDCLSFSAASGSSVS